MAIVLTCRVCGNPFRAKRRGKPETTCSPECREVDRAAWRDANPEQRKGRKAAPVRELVCAACGETFQAPRRRGRIPATCSHECHLAYRRRYVRGRKPPADAGTLPLFEPVENAGGEA